MVGDVSLGDWTPPPSRVDRDWAAWLRSDPPARETTRSELRWTALGARKPSEARIQGMTDPPLAFPDDGPLQHLTSEELVIVRDQRQIREHEPVVANPQPPSQDTETPALVVETSDSGADPSWDSVLCDHGEHLTDEEILGAKRTTFAPDRRVTPRPPAPAAPPQRTSSLTRRFGFPPLSCPATHQSRLTGQGDRKVIDHVGPGPGPGPGPMCFETKTKT